MVEEEAAQGEFEIIQAKTFVPNPNPVIEEFGEMGLTIVPLPEINVQIPVPTTGALAAIMVFGIVIHRVCDGPAFAVVGSAMPVMITSSKEATQGAFEMVHLKVLFPTPNPVMLVFGELGETIVPLPPIKVQAPVPAVGVFAAITALELTQTV